MSILRIQDRETNEPGDAAVIATILAEMRLDMRWSLTDLRRVGGWERTIRNRLTREAGCGYSVSLRIQRDLLRLLCETKAAAGE